MRAVTRNSVGILTDAQFETYVVNRTRDYDMVLLFSYTQDRTVCPTCIKTNDAFVKTSHRWKELRVDSPKLIFSVITVDEESQLADVS